MAALFKNREVRSFSIYFLLISILCLALLTLVIQTNIKGINEVLIKQNIAAVGAMVRQYPELENIIVKNYIAGYEEDYVYGSKILKKYSYNEHMAPYKNTPLSNFYSQYFGRCFFLVSAFILLFFLIALINLNHIFNKVRKFQVAAERIVEGDFSESFESHKEGDLYILGHEFNQMSNRLQENLKALKREKNLLKDIISDITHQLKTPLASLIMFNELMREDAHMDEEERIKFLTISKNQLDRIEWLIKSLLKMARFEAGVVLFNKVNAPIYNTITAAMEGIELSAKQKNITIKIEGSKESSIEHDSDWTAEALSNIIKNGIEHSVQNSMIHITWEETPLSLQMIIEDKGCGIKEEELPKIFNRFYKGQRSTNPMSIGIGLYITKTILEAHNGSIVVYSQEGKGTKFVITFLRTIV